MKGSMLAVLLLGCVMAVRAACPSAGDISPCQCREETPGRIMDCTKVSDSNTLAKVFQANMPDTNFKFFEIVPLDGQSSLEALPANVFNGVTFMFMWIGKSNIATVDAQAFSGMEKKLLEITMADSTKMTQFPFGSMAEQTVLYKIEVTNSQLKTLDSLGAAPALAQVILSGGQIATISANAVKDLPMLTRLDLSFNPLTSLEDNWLAASTTGSWVAYFEGCSIATISAGAFSGSLPNGVMLKNNKLTALPEGTFRPLLEHMSTTAGAGEHTLWVDVTGNPLECDCGVQWLTKDAALHSFIKGAVCKNGDVSGTAIQDLPDSFFEGC